MILICMCKTLYSLILYMNRLHLAKRKINDIVYNPTKPLTRHFDVYALAMSRTFLWLIVTE
jgi:hypothetical protein